MKRILIVDDFELGRLVLREKLQILGYLCEEAKNGSEALNLLRTQIFDLVISDHNMPVMTGLEMLQGLAAMPKDQQPPVIFITGRPSDKVSMDAKSAGACAVLAKPYNDQKLIFEINRILKQTNRALTSYHSRLSLRKSEIL